MDIFTKIILCLLAADFITGLFHWFEDTYGTISDSWLSKNFWEPNIMHHKYPSDITKSSFWGRNYLQWFMGAIGIGIFYFTPIFCWELVLIIILSTFGNEVHVWSHSKKNNWLIELLQEMNLVQTKLHHAKHHINPYSVRYCILTNWLNPILERIHFWKVLEFILSPIIIPKRGLPEREGY